MHELTHETGLMGTMKLIEILPSSYYGDHKRIIHSHYCIKRPPSKDVRTLMNPGLNRSG